MSEMVRLDGNYSIALVLQYNDVGMFGLAYLVAESQVLLAVALSDLDGVINVGDGHAIVCDVLDRTTTASTLEVAGESRRSAGPDLDTRTVGSIGHADVVHIDVLNVVDLTRVLAQRTYTDAVATVADKVLNNDVGAVRLERDTVIAVVNV